MRKRENLAPRSFSIDLIDRMNTTARILVATFVLWLVTAWSLPMCCLAMGATASHRHAGSSMTMDMSGHHHHHMSSASDRSAKRLSANESCAQTCGAMSDTTAVTLAAKGALDRLQQTSVTAAAAPMAP